MRIESRESTVILQFGFGSTPKIPITVETNVFLTLFARDFPSLAKIPFPIPFAQKIKRAMHARNMAPSHLNTDIVQE